LQTRTNPQHGSQYQPTKWVWSQAAAPFAHASAERIVDPVVAPRQSGFRVLVAFDDTPASWSALQKASDIAAAARGTLTIAHVTQPRVSALDLGSTMLRALEAEREQAWNLLASASESVRSARSPHLECLAAIRWMRLSNTRVSWRRISSSSAVIGVGHWSDMWSVASPTALCDAPPCQCWWCRY